MHSDKQSRPTWRDAIRAKRGHPKGLGRPLRGRRIRLARDQVIAPRTGCKAPLSEIGLYLYWGDASAPLQVRNPDATGLETREGAFMSSNLPSCRPRGDRGRQSRRSHSESLAGTMCRRARSGRDVAAGGHVDLTTTREKTAMSHQQVRVQRMSDTSTKVRDRAGARQRSSSKEAATVRIPNGTTSLSPASGGS